MTKSWICTREAKSRLAGRIHNGIYFGRHIIERDTPIDKGVSLGTIPREALVVDYNKSSALKNLYKIAYSKASINSKIVRDRVLHAVYLTVDEAFPIRSNEEVEKIIAEYGGFDDQKVSLNHFIEKGAGVCRHFALTNGVLLEVFKREGHIKGNPSIDRNRDIFSGHMWTRYTNSNRSVIILDQAQGFFGFLEEAICRGLWDYRRPGE